MKKWTIGFIISIICLFMVPAISFAQAEQDDVLHAKRLNQLGLFHGTDKGFELERESTRVEAVVMLIRLLGKEDQALNSQDQLSMHPFTDVPSWAERYVAYAYEQRLAMGVSGTKFGSDDAVTAAQYYTFVLRALGYQDGEAGDFRWDLAVDKARDIGIAGAERYADGAQRLTRGDMASISAHSLEVSMKGETATLLDKLVAEGAVTQEQLAALQAEQAGENGDDGEVSDQDEDASAQATEGTGPRREGTRLIFPVEPKDNTQGINFYHINNDDVFKLLPTAHHFRISFYGRFPGESDASLPTSGLVNAMLERGTIYNLLSEQELAVNPEEAAYANDTVSLWAIFDKDEQVLAYSMNDGLSADRSEWTFETELPGDFTAMMVKAKELSRDAYEFPNTLFYPASYEYMVMNEEGEPVAKLAKTLLLDHSQLPESARGYTEVSWLTFMKGPAVGPIKPIQSIEDFDNIQVVLENNRLAALRAENLGHYYGMPNIGEATFSSLVQPGAESVSFAFVFLIDEQGKILAYSYYTSADLERWRTQPVEGL